MKNIKQKNNLVHRKLFVNLIILLIFSISLFVIGNISINLKVKALDKETYLNSVQIFSDAASDPGCNDVDPKTPCEITADCNKKGVSQDERLHPNNCGITSLVARITNIMSALVGIVIIVVIIIGGIQYSASSGDPQAAAAAKKRISNALIALLAYVAMYGFLQWIIPGGLF